MIYNTQKNVSQITLEQFVCYGVGVSTQLFGAKITTIN